MPINRCERSNHRSYLGRQPAIDPIHGPDCFIWALWSSSRRIMRSSSKDSRRYDTFYICSLEHCFPNWCLWPLVGFGSIAKGSWLCRIFNGKHCYKFYCKDLWTGYAASVTHYTLIKNMLRYNTFIITILTELKV